MRKQFRWLGLGLWFVTLLPGSAAVAQSMSASFSFFQDGPAQAADGVISYTSSPRSRWTAYESPNTQDWLMADFGATVAIDRADIYVFGDGSGVRAPSSLSIQFWSGAAWVEVASPTSTPQTPVANQLNTVTFSAVSASRFRVSFVHAAGTRSGVTELIFRMGTGTGMTPVDPEPPEPEPGTSLPTPSVSASYTFSQDSALAVIDGVISYTATPRNRWTSYLSPNASDWLELSYSSAVSVSRVTIAFYDDGGGVRVPQSYDVQSWTGNDFTSVPGQTHMPASSTAGTLNVTTFTSVTASRLRVVFTHVAGAKTGVTEWTVGGSSAAPGPPPTPPEPPKQLSVSASYTYSQDRVEQAADGIRSYTNSPRNRWTAYGSPSSVDWIELDYGSPVTQNLANVEFYEDGGGVRLPASYEVQYWGGSSWSSAPVQVRVPALVTPFITNIVSFDSVTSARFRLVMTHAPGAESGVTELSFTTGTPPTPPPANYPPLRVSVTTPEYGAQIAGNTRITFYAPGMQSVSASAWHQPDLSQPDPRGYSDSFATAAISGTGFGEIMFPADAFPSGPTTLLLTATGQNTVDVAYLQLFNTGGVDWQQGLPGTPLHAVGMSVVYQDDFTGALSATRTGIGATYASSKPDRADGSEFGSAIFADLGGPIDPFAILGWQYLRIRASKTPANYVDPAGRQYGGGLLSSLRTDGTGVAVQYGYFEARMLMPAGQGAWPAFWLLSQNSVSQQLSTTAEVDVVEGYGHAPETACRSNHLWGVTPEIHATHCALSNSRGDAAQSFHVYAVKIEPIFTIFYIDDIEVWRQLTTVQAQTPMYFLVNLALGGGFPVDLSRYDDHVDLFVDYIRVLR